MPSGKLKPQRVAVFDVELCFVVNCQVGICKRQRHCKAHHKTQLGVRRVITNAIGDEDYVMIMRVIRYDMHAMSSMVTKYIGPGQGCMCDIKGFLRGACGNSRARRGRGRRVPYHDGQLLDVILGMTVPNVDLHVLPVESDIG